MKPIVFTNANIFDGTGAPLFPGEVRIEADTIVAVARGSETVSRDGAEIVDCEGQTLMPGMVEAHAHLTWPSSVERVINAMKLPLDLTTVFQGVLLMCVLAADCFSTYRVRIVSGGAR